PSLLGQPSRQRGESMEEGMRRSLCALTRLFAGLLSAWFLSAGLLSNGPIALAQSQPEAKDMALVGSSDLQARSAYQPTIHEQSGRWIAYIGHHGGTSEAPKPRNSLSGVEEFNGTSILDVTDPHHPEYLAHIPGQAGLAEQGGAQMVRVCDGRALPKGEANAVYML